MLNMKRHTADLSQDTGERQGGFTIVELMIALSVLSALLVMSTVIMMQLGRLYTKGVNEADTQNTSRNIMNDLSSQLQLSGNTPILDPGNSNGVICLGTQRYTYSLNNEVTDDPTSHALWRDTTSGNGSCTAVDLHAQAPQDTQSKAGSGVEMIPLHMRLLALSIVANSNNTYGISVTVAYGDDDLMANTNVSGDNTETDPAAHHHNLGLPGTVLCKGQTGQEFCSVSSLSITVAQRIVQ